MLKSVQQPGLSEPEQQLLAKMPRTKPDPGKIAVLLNRNARRVTDKVARQFERIVGSDHVFQSHTLDEAEAFAREIVQRGYGTIVCGGGDGTLMRAVNLVHRYIAEANQWRAERYKRCGQEQALIENPRFAFLKLGTGNGMRQVVGANKPHVDLQKIVDFVPGRTQTIPLIDLDGERFFFGGAGYDSQILDDYNWIKARAKNRLFKAIMQNAVGYLVALFARTVPRLVAHGTHLEGRIVNRGRAYFVDPRRGDFVQEIPAGETLFEGNMRSVLAGTVGFFGAGFRIFPFARMMPGLMNLRIATLGPLRLVPVIPKLWSGTYRNASGLFDFLVENVSIELEHPFPFQHSGDAQGLRDRLDLRIADDTLELIDLYRPRRTS